MRTKKTHKDRQLIVLGIEILYSRFVPLGKKILHVLKKIFARFMSLKLRYRFIIATAIIVLAEVYSVLTPLFNDRSYALGTAETLLPTTSPQMAAYVSLDATKQQFNFKPTSSSTPTTFSAQSNYSSASLYADSSKGITTTDSVNKVDFTMTPKFATYTGRQDQDRIVYPLYDGSGWMVYTLRGDGVKEDIILEHARSDTASYSYSLGLGTSLNAKIEVDGSVGIYGSTLLSGNVATDNSSDAALLEKARQNAPKNTLLFDIPTPVIVDKNGPVKNIPAKYSLSGNVLTVNVTGLKKGMYPLSIDPSVYVVTAAQFMAGNNETNIDFDVNNKLIKKASTTGARINQWNSTSGLPAAAWGSETVASGGYVYSVGGTSSSGQTFTSQGANTYTVPAGVTSVSVKAWGGGGAGAGGGNPGSGTPNGGNGGGSGAVATTLTVTPGETLSVYVGGGGTAGAFNSGGNDAGGGGGGGGYSSVYRSATALAIAAGGGGGGGARQYLAGGAGGPGGCTSSGIACYGIGGSGGIGAGGGGSSSAGGSGGSGQNGNNGTGGSSLIAGQGAGGSNNGAASTGGGAAGGLASGGNAGLPNINTTRASGGGGGSGLFGGGGGGGTASSTSQSGAAGGGGSNYTTDTSYIGSAIDAGNLGDAARNGAGEGGAGGTASNNGNNGANGLVAISYGSGSSYVSSNVNWAQFNTGSGTIDSPNPGNGACSGWCSASAYNLPDGRANFSLVAYNGFLYAMGGTSANCTTGSGTGNSGYCNTVYISKLGANGEPRLWSPTSSDTSTWTYWYRDTNLPSERAYSGAVAYNNHMYFMGGRTAGGATNVVHVANITPTGQLGTWTSSGYTLPATNQYDFSVQQYNGNIYIIGGSSGPSGTPSSSVWYSNINTSGTINSWQQTSSFTTGRISGGSNLSVVWGAYIYISGGCTAVNASGYCTNIASDAQVASINADGSIDNWNTMAGVTDARMSYSLVAWRNNIYEIGGCSSQNTTTGDCNSGMLSTINYGSVNTDGDASTVGNTVPGGTAPCSGGSPYNCNLPSSIGNILNATAIINGYLYVMGGCTNLACTTVSTTITYQAIGSDGSLKRPTTCSGAYTDSYCISPTSLPTGLAASGSAIFNGRIYLVGGFTTGSNIYYVTVNSDGSLGAWSSVSLSSIGAPATLDYSYAFTKANPTASSTIPGNLYIIGGCTSAAVGCSGYSSVVDKCNLSISGVPSACSTSGQVQLQNVNNGGDCGSGLGAMVGSVYAGYIYLIGGLTPNCVDLKTARYAKIDSNNNIVTVGTGWVEGPNQTATGRRRGAGFGYNGYIYVVGGYDGTSGVLADIEFAKINVSDGSWGTWTVSAVTINQRWGLSVPVSNSYAYVIGGCIAGAAPSSCSSSTNVTQTFQIYNNDSGAPASYSTSAHTYATNPNRIGVTSAILNGYLYVAGGCTGTVDCNSAVTNVSYAPIDVYGNVGTWTNTTGSLPSAQSWGKLLTAGGSLYYVGGQNTNGASQSTVYYATPSSGDVSSWSTASNGLPASRTQFGAAVWNNRLYVVGGATGNAGTTIYPTGTSTFVVPAGISSLTIKAWGGGGGGGAGGSAAAGGTGAGGGYETATIAVTAGETLNIGVGGGGQQGGRNTAGGGAGGGGESGVQRGTTSLIIASGGGGGGGGGNTAGYTGGTGAPGGGTSGTTGSTSNAQATGGAGGTQTTGGAGGTGGYCTGQTGGYLDGGNGGDGRTTGSCGGNGGIYGGHAGTGFLTGAGDGGGVLVTTRAGGGGGGSGYFAGGGGSGAGTTSGGGGGGSGSSYAVTGATGVTNTAGSGINPGNSSDPLLNGGGLGGIAGAVANTGTDGSSGTLVISWGSNTVTSTIYVSPVLNSGGNITSAWSTASTSFNVARTNLVAVAYANNLYVLGGYDGNNYLSDTQFSQINSTTGDAGSWQYSRSLPGPLAGGDGFAANGYIYIVGGRSATASCSPTTLVAPISANTTIASGNNPTGIGDWFQTNQAFTGDRYGNAAVYSKGKVYVMGGACGAILNYPTTSIQQTTLLSQPQVANYSIAFDTDSDVYPTNWLLNGVDNSIGARWQLSYQSMTDPTKNGPNGLGKNCSTAAMTNWGQTTNFGNVTLKQPGIYTALDSSGANTNCARYYFLNISVDAQNSFGYPDDVTRGPTITDLTLAFTADPAKRLMHGRTFVGGLQQPDDTPYYAH
jgi:hypothetical protein